MTYTIFDGTIDDMRVDRYSSSYLPHPLTSYLQAEKILEVLDSIEFRELSKYD
jgi:hypothetical protein